MSRPRHPTGLVAVAVLLLAACQGASQSAPSSSSAPEPSAAAAPATPASTPAPSIGAGPSLTPMPAPSFAVSAAAAAYLAASTAANTEFNAALAKLPRTNATLTQLRSWGLAMAKIEQKFVDQIRAIVFPPTMTSKVESYLSQRSLSAALELKVGSAKTLDDALSYFNQLVPLSDSAVKIANSIRADLGLPPVPVVSN